MKYINNNQQTVAEQAYTPKRRKPKATHASVPVYPQQVTVGESKGFHSSAKLWSRRFCDCGFTTWNTPSALHQILRNLRLVVLSVSVNEHVEWRQREFQYPVFLSTSGCPHSWVRTSVLLFPLPDSLVPSLSITLGVFRSSDVKAWVPPSVSERSIKKNYICVPQYKVPPFSSFLWQSNIPFSVEY